MDLISVIRDVIKNLNDFKKAKITFRPHWGSNFYINKGINREYIFKTFLSKGV